MTNFKRAGRQRSMTLRLFFLSSLLLISRLVLAQSPGHKVRNIVLVHGAWADGSG